MALVKTVQVEVTQDDIAQGERYSRRACPIARALDRIVKQDTVVVVGEWKVRLYPNTKAYMEPAGEFRVIEMPYQASGFVMRFDAGVDVRPLWLEFSIPEELLK